MGKLTVKQVENAKPGEKDIYLRDGYGLELRVFPSGKRAWQFRYRFGEKRRVLSMGSLDLLTLKQARDTALEARKLLEQGIDPLEHEREKAFESQAAMEAARIAQESRRTFEKTVVEWAELALSRRKNGSKELLRRFDKDVMPYIGEKELGQIRRADLLAILDRITQRGANVLANHVFGDLRQFFNWCEARELIEKHPLRGLKKTDIGGSQTERDRVLSADEIKMLKEKLPEAYMEHQTELAIWLMLSTLARVGELTQARWQHIDLDAGTWTIPAGNSKNAKEHIIYLSDFALSHFKELNTLNGHSAWCFPSTQKDDHHLDLRSISKQIKDRQRTEALSNRSLKGLGALILPGGGWTPHDLRRTGATMMGELGVLSEVIERCLNHVEPNRLKRTYQRHELKAERQDAWQRLGDMLDELLSHKERKIISIREASRT